MLKENMLKLKIATYINFKFLKHLWEKLSIVYFAIQLNKKI